jgi:cysteinyl-tRNA synthetase
MRMPELALLPLLALLAGPAAAFSRTPLLLPPGRAAQSRTHVADWPLAALRRLPCGCAGRDARAGRRRLAMSATDSPRAFNLYNTLARDKQPFKPMAADGKAVKMYTCGPTVYDFAHIGNFRAFLTYDLLKRWLTYCGYDVDHVCNLTDIDDKIIQRMKRDNIGLKELTDKYAAFFFEDLNSLNIVPARHYPRATENVDVIVEMIEGLVSKGNAYEKDGSFYFDVGSFGGYGKLARLDFDNMQDGAGEGGGITDPEAFSKKNSRDFALWKAYKEEDATVVWDTRIGRGMPVIVLLVLVLPYQD